ncbi:hypothetical protein E2C01_025749 [Portunus trituberculatus]|uniref:Uncharacterized protein n=1 Tax=Portunus trituberculatus TaxID=210409 RepID=A0A5B7EGA2_PORTR|nr:hypothetical protein [Portunus trituberculatus]
MRLGLDCAGLSHAILCLHRTACLPACLHASAAAATPLSPPRFSRTAFGSAGKVVFAFGSRNIKR